MAVCSTSNLDMQEQTDAVTNSARSPVFIVSCVAHLDCDIVKLAQLFSFHGNLGGQLSRRADDQGRYFARCSGLHLRI